ncbi:tetratricopeptide repeat-containing glycosyltransferase family 2 protein [Paenibacillus lactis]|uniref:tetratricopeptide repeat-containing glycosyltransferase family 2 protein n=1 Tax=Paenibacillus lactis TaxID=228574 RepID=UPI001B184251|nr:glycosyltransferase [Paenibacillus lactis]GIO92576.1 hypothetical protein J31TS3_38030 [Paenibacillus lactis]
MFNKVPVSACLIVKDEETNIEACIVQLQKVVQEIIVVDTGSKDNTKKILGDLAVQVYDFAWNDDFSAARNYSISLASQPYILIIDADEVLDTDSITQLMDYATSSKGKPAKVILKNHMDDGSCVISEITRLFPNKNEYRYYGRIHEQLRLNGQEIVYSDSTNVVIHHYGYLRSEIVQKNKTDRNINLLKQQLLLEPESSYTLFQLGQTFYVKGEYKKAIIYFDDAIKLFSKFSELPNYAPTLFLSYGYCLLREKEYDVLELILRDAIDLFPDYTDLYFLYGSMLIEQKSFENFEDIKVVFEHCLSLGEVCSAKYESVEGVGSFRAAYNLGLYYEVIGDQQNARKYYRQSADQNFIPASNRLSDLNLNW